MQADRNDRHGSNESPSRHSTQTMITAIAVVILAGAAYLLAPSDDDDETMIDEAPVAETTPVLEAPQPEPVEAVIAAPDIPDEVVDELPAVEEEPEELPEPPPPPPTAEELDAELRSAMGDMQLQAGPGLEAALAAPYLMDRAVSSVDQLARGLVPRRTLSLARPAGRFPVTGTGDNVRLDPAGYTRYDSIVSSIVALPTADIASLFHTFRSPLQSAYAALGYPADKADNTLIAALDAIINAPTRNAPPALVSKGALWAYADPSLENASDLHQQLLRTGPENTRRLQDWAAELRSALLSTSP